MSGRIKLTQVQRSTLRRLRRAQRNRGSALAKSWPYWENFTKATLDALRRKGLLVDHGDQVIVNTQRKIRP